jgi:hypothetical protein
LRARFADILRGTGRGWPSQAANGVTIGKKIVRSNRENQYHLGTPREKAGK